MIKTILRHHVYDMFLTTLFNGFIDTFSDNDATTDIPMVGKYYSKISHIDGYETFYNCIVKHVEQITETTAFVKIAFDYVNDMTVDGLESDQLTSDEFSDIYGNPDDDDSDIELLDEYPDADVVEDDGIDLILNDDKTVSINTEFYIFQL